MLKKIIAISLLYMIIFSNTANAVESDYKSLFHDRKYEIMQSCKPSMIIIEDVDIKKNDYSIISNDQIIKLKENDHKIEIVHEIEDRGGWGFNPAGVYNYKTKSIIIDEEYFKYAFNHEYGHFIDCINNDISFSEEFINIYESEKEKLFPEEESKNHRYYKKSNDEYFGFAYKVYRENPNMLKERAIRTFKFIDAIEGLYNTNNKSTLVDYD